MSARLLRRCGASALAAVAAVAASLTAADPARADVSISSATLSTSTIILNGDAGCGDRSTITVKLFDPAGDDDEVFGVDADVIQASTGDISDIVLLTAGARSGDYVTYTGRIFVCGFEDPGKYTVRITADWWDEEILDGRVAERNLTLSIKRPSTLTYNASPEPVKRGSSLTHTGQLKRDPFAYGPMYGAKGVTVKFYFRAYTWQNYLYKGSVVTGTNGYYSKKIAAWDSGWWKVVYEGDAWRQGVTKWDEVKLKS